MFLQNRDLQSYSPHQGFRLIHRVGHSSHIRLGEFEIRELRIGNNLRSLGRYTGGFQGKLKTRSPFLITKDIPGLVSETIPISNTLRMSLGLSRTTENLRFKIGDSRDSR